MKLLGISFTLSLSFLIADLVDYNLELLSVIEFDNDNNNYGVSDVWGYTDEHGNEYAIVGHKDGTAIYDVSTAPNNPIEIINIPGPSNGDYYYHRDYKTYDNYLYIVNEMTGPDVGMQVIDLSPLPFSSPEQIEIPNDFLDRPPSKAIIDSVRELRRRHPDACVVGKVMGPWTLSYHMFGVQDFLINILLDPDYVHACLTGLQDVSVMFANAQFEAGADVVTLADHATGDLVRADSYRDFLLPVHKQITPRIDGPVVFHCCGNTLDRFEHLTQAGFTAFHFANENEPNAAREAAGEFPLVGNVANVSSLMNGTIADVRSEVERVYAAGIDVISPECAVPMQAPDENLRAIVETVENLAAAEL